MVIWDLSSLKLRVQLGGVVSNAGWKLALSSRVGILYYIIGKPFLAYMCERKFFAAGESVLTNRGHTI